MGNEIRPTLNATKIKFECEESRVRGRERAETKLIVGMAGDECGRAAAGGDGGEPEAF